MVRLASKLSFTSTTVRAPSPKRVRGRLTRRSRETAPVSLLLTTLLVKSSDNSLVMSYVENMGTFVPQEKAHRFSAKECPSIPGSSFLRTVYRLIVRLQDSITTATYFESEVRTRTPRQSKR